MLYPFSRVSETGIVLPVAIGDFILVDYTTRIRETGEVFDTTSIEEAKKGGIYKEGSRYEPMLVVVGEGWVLKSLDDSLVGLEVDKESTFEIPPSQGFGERDPNKIRMIPITRFRKQGGGQIYPGMQIEVDNRPAVIRAVGGGRVQVDFNPPLAGKTLVYNVIVKGVLTDDLEKAKALVHRRMPGPSIEKFKIDLLGNEVTIELPEEAFNLEGIQPAMRGLAADLQRLLSTVEKVTFLEIFVKEKQVPAPSSQSPVPSAD